MKLAESKWAEVSVISVILKCLVSVYIHKDVSFGCFQRLSVAQEVQPIFKESDPYDCKESDLYCTYQE